MIFSSITFLFGFLPLFLALYFLSPLKFRNWVLLIASYFFFAWGAPKFAVFLLFSTLIDYIISIFIDRYRESKAIARNFLLLSLLFNFSQLFYLKYVNFFIDNVNALASYLHITKPMPWHSVMLPLGISFITFHKISYIVDVYRGIKPTKKFTEFALYIALFPPLIAGPIIRFHDIYEQLKASQRQVDSEDIMLGIYRFCIGLAKKILIADQLGVVADKVFAMPTSQLTFIPAWLGILCYTLQIYFDFSGYSDMAIGLCRILGFNLLGNFNKPYIAQTITEFWQRWHISLSRWMKEYLYIPLGGNRVSSLRMYFNLWIVFLFSGLWHGANWTFLAWGAYHGFFISIDKLFWSKVSQRLPKIINIVITFMIVMLGWVLFRSNTLSSALSYSHHLFMVSTVSWHINPLGYLVDPAHRYAQWLIVMSRSQMLIFCLALLICFVPASTCLNEYGRQCWQYCTASVRMGCQGLTAFSLFVLSFMFLATAGFHPFIYFKF